MSARESALEKAVAELNVRLKAKEQECLELTEKYSNAVEELHIMDETITKLEAEITVLTKTNRNGGGSSDNDFLSEQFHEIKKMILKVERKIEQPSVSRPYSSNGPPPRRLESPSNRYQESLPPRRQESLPPPPPRRQDNGGSQLDIAPVRLGRPGRPPGQNARFTPVHTAEPAKFADDNYIWLPPDHRVKAHKDAYLPYRHDGPENFVSKLISGVFSFDEIMGYTWCGRNTGRFKNEEIQAKAKVAKANGAKAMDLGKRNAVIAAVLYHNPRCDPAKIRAKASWKVARMNCGFLSTLDCSIWEGYDRDRYMAAVRKHRPTYNGDRLPKYSYNLGGPSGSDRVRNGTAHGSDGSNDVMEVEVEVQVNEGDSEYGSETEEENNGNGVEKEEPIEKDHFEYVTYVEGSDYYT